jgi:hypothetical protein
VNGLEREEKRKQSSPSKENNQFQTKQPISNKTTNFKQNNQTTTTTMQKILLYSAAACALATSADALSMNQVASVWKQNGGSSSSCPTAVAVAWAESRGNPGATGRNPGSYDRGLWQINSKWHPDVSDSCAYNAACNAKNAVRISSGGSRWSPWATYNDGLHHKFMGQARSACSSSRDELDEENVGGLQTRIIKEVAKRVFKDKLDEEVGGPWGTAGSIIWNDFNRGVANGECNGRCQDEMEADFEDCVENCQEERGLSGRSCRRRCKLASVTKGTRLSKDTFSSADELMQRRLLSHPWMTKLATSRLNSGPDGSCVATTLGNMDRLGVPSFQGGTTADPNNSRGAMVQMVKAGRWKSLNLPGARSTTIRSSYGTISAYVISADSYEKIAYNKGIPSGSIIFQTRHGWNANSGASGNDMGIVRDGGRYTFNYKLMSPIIYSNAKEVVILVPR